VEASISNMFLYGLLWCYWTLVVSLTCAFWNSSSKANLLCKNSCLHRPYLHLYACA